MNIHLLAKRFLVFINITLILAYFSSDLIGQVQKDDPNLDQIPQWYYENPINNTRVASQVITINDYDNYFLGVDFAEGHNSVNPLEPTEFFTAFNIDNPHHTENGHDWERTYPSWGSSVNGDPVTAYDADGYLYYETMYGGITGCKVARSSDNGQTWDFVKIAISGFDKNWIAADQTDGPYSNYVYTTMTGGDGGNFARSTDQGESWTTTWSTSSQSLPGMMVCVGPDGDTDGGSVYVVTNSGNTFSPTYTFYESNDGGETFTFKSAQNFAGYVGTASNNRHSVENMRTRPYPFIAADNSDGDYRGRLYLVYASNDPPGSGNKPDIFSHYSDDSGETWSAAKKVNSGFFILNSHQWAPAIWCDTETGNLYVQWMDSRNSPTNDSAAIYATYSDDGGQTFKPNQRISNEMMVINCTSCGGGGSPRYQGDYNSIVSNGEVSQAAWGDFRYGNFASFTAYFPDFAMRIYPESRQIAYQDTVWAVVPGVKLYDNEAIFTATMQQPGSGSFTVSYPFGQSITSFPDSVPILITVDNVPVGNYTLTVKGEGPNGTPVHFRESNIQVIPLPPPEADFIASATEVCVDAAIDFTDKTLHNPTSWVWTFEGGDPETSTEQNPTGITYKTDGTFDVTLNVTNNTGTDEMIKTDYITVSVQPEPPTGDNKSVCVYDSIPYLEVTGTDVVWYKNPELDTILHEGNEFNTGQTEVGTYSYYVTQSTFSCESKASQISLTINPIPDVSFDTLSAVCENDAPMELTGGSPVEGMYFGPGVESGLFDPAVVGEGMHTIGYAYADENSCTDTAYQDIMVYAAPDVTLDPLGAGCINDEPFTLTGGSPEEGTYSGDGVEDNMFYPEVAGEGEHMITYTWADTTGCMNSASQTYTVYGLPQVDVGNDTAVCGERSIVLDATTADAASYLWTPGNATTASITVDSTGIGFASQEFVVEVTDNNGCMNSDAVTVGFFDCTGIDEIAGLEAFNIFPNPNDGQFTLGISSSKTVNLNVLIYNNSGKVFYEQSNVRVDNRYQSQITLPDASAGIYFVVLESEGKKVFRKVLIRK
jgi:PKD repeat protein